MSNTGGPSQPKVKRGVGRPRATGAAPAGPRTRDDVLAAAGRLFAERGYAATSTRAIAEAAGIRQATLYNHFPGKEEILTTLLEQTVRAALAFSTELATKQATPEAKLWALCDFDVRVLLNDPHNLGVLFQLPEVSGPQFTEVRAHRDELWIAYRHLITATGRHAGTEDLATRLICGLIESVTQSRPSGGETDINTVATSIADSILRILGCDDTQLAAARSAAMPLRQ